MKPVTEKINEVVSNTGDLIYDTKIDKILWHYGIVANLESIILDMILQTQVEELEERDE